MGMANFTIKMGGCMMGIGNKTKWKDLANFIINLASLPIRVNGREISLWAKVFFIMKFHKC
jgi:hypothetical protein